MHAGKHPQEGLCYTQHATGSRQGESHVECQGRGRGIPPNEKPDIMLWGGARFGVLGRLFCLLTYHPHTAWPGRAVRDREAEPGSAGVP